MSYPGRIASGVVTLNVCRTVVCDTTRVSHFALQHTECVACLACHMRVVSLDTSAIRHECRAGAVRYAGRIARGVATLAECHRFSGDTSRLSLLLNMDAKDPRRQSYDCVRDTLLRTELCLLH